MLLGIKRQCHEINQAFNSMGFCNNVQFEHFTVSQKYHGTYSIPTVLFGRPTLISLKFFSWPILPLPAKVPKTPRERVVNGAVKWVLRTTLVPAGYLATYGGCSTQSAPPRQVLTARSGLQIHIWQRWTYFAPPLVFLSLLQLGMIMALGNGNKKMREGVKGGGGTKWG